jgi:hypothetical protein
MSDIVVRTNEADEKFQKLVQTVYDIVARYIKDYKDPESWVPYYSEALNLKFPAITFSESNVLFKEKVGKVLDLMELSHLYVKVTNPKSYNKETHNSVVHVKGAIVDGLERLELHEMNELMQHISTSILRGNN